MDLQLAKFLVELADDSGEYDMDDVYVREDYSGRAMYGKTTAAVVGLNCNDVAYLVLQNAQDDDCFYERLEPITSIKPLKQDSMGLSTIIY